MPICWNIKGRHVSRSFISISFSRQPSFLSGPSHHYGAVIEPDLVWSIQFIVTQMVTIGSHQLKGYAMKCMSLWPPYSVPATFLALWLSLGLVFLYSECKYQTFPMQIHSFSYKEGKEVVTLEWGWSSNWEYQTYQIKIIGFLSPNIHPTEGTGEAKNTKNDEKRDEQLRNKL